MAILAGTSPALAASETVIYPFKGGSDGDMPWASLLNVGGTLYGTTRYGGGSTNCPDKEGCGTVFKVTPTGVETMIYAFKGGISDGAYPTAALINVGGTLYGTTLGGGLAGCQAGGCGTVFSVTPAGAETLVYSFKGLNKNGHNDGFGPVGGLINVGGTLYGTTFFGGSGSLCEFGCGTVFRLTKDRTEELVYSFDGGSDGAAPFAGLIEVGGTLYGTTSNGGSGNCASGCGTIFSTTKDGAHAVVYSFKGGTDGATPTASLISVGGLLFGTTSVGGVNDNGTAFGVTPTGAETVVYSFKGGTGDGAFPAAAMINVRGTLYGTTSRGGSSNNGTVFSLTPTGAHATLYSFRSTNDGGVPLATLINVGGTLYGTTEFGFSANCSEGCGTVFALKP